MLVCDATLAYGFGVVQRPCSIELVEAVGSLAERRGDYVKFDPEPGSPPPKDRLGNPHPLRSRQKQFKVVISAMARWQAHSGSLEAHGLLLALKWVLRTPKRFNHRIVILIDAKAVLGAVTKGRMSAPGIRGILRRIAALLLATNALARLVYVPTEHNPADAPSRGKRARHLMCMKRRTAKSRLLSPTERRLTELEKSYFRLLDVWGDSAFSSWAS